MLANLISDRSIHLLWSLITRDGHAPLFPMRISAYWRIYAIIPHICPNIFCGAFSRTRMAIPNNHSYNLSCHRTLTRWTLRTTPAALCGISQRPGCSGKIWIQPSCQTVDTLWHMMKMQFHTCVFQELWQDSSRQEGDNVRLLCQPLRRHHLHHQVPTTHILVLCFLSRHDICQIFTTTNFP